MKRAIGSSMQQLCIIRHKLLTEDTMMGCKETVPAPCGIDCGRCNLFCAPDDEQAAASLVAWFKNEGWLKEDEGAREIMKRGPYCNGCRGDRSVQWSGDCLIRKCCVDDRRLQFCSECDEFPCETLVSWARNGAHHAQALDRLKAMKGKPRGT
jgi:hypothetical protein